MANQFLTAEAIARTALATLYETTVMANLIWRDPWDQEFATGKRGDRINIRKPVVFEAREFDPEEGIEIQDAVEDSTDLVLNHHADTSFAVTSRDMTLEIDDFAGRLLDPAMISIMQKIERDILSVRDDVTQEVGVSGGGLHSWDDPRVMIDAGEILDDNNAPDDQRFVAVGATTKARWLADPLMHEADKRGGTEGLTRASIGRSVFGFDAYRAGHIRRPEQGPGISTTEVGVAFHRHAIGMAFRPLELPPGAADAAIVGYQGFGLRVVRDYDIKFKTETISVDCLYGIKLLRPELAVLIKGADGASGGGGD